MVEQIHRHTGASVRHICQTLRLPRSSFYSANTSVTAREGAGGGGHRHSAAAFSIAERIRQIFLQHRRRYGYRRIWHQLRDEAITCSPARVRRIMARGGLRAICPRRYIPRTSDGRADRPSPNLLHGKPLPSQPHRVWAGDITFIPTEGGWLYLAVVLDLCTRKVVGWSLADHMRADLVTAAMQQALGSLPLSHPAAAAAAHRNRRTTPHNDAGTGLIFHSDRGSQYSSIAFRNLLQRHNIEQSMSARANPYHNAFTESFIGTLKTEMLQNGSFLNANDATLEIFEFIEMYYHNTRKHSSLDYKTPHQFEQLIAMRN